MAGTTDLEDEYAIKRRVKHVFEHPYWFVDDVTGTRRKSNPEFWYHDLSILELIEPINLKSTNARKVCLPNTRDLYQFGSWQNWHNDKKFITSGWGLNKEKGIEPNRKLLVLGDTDELIWIDPEGY